MLKIAVIGEKDLITSQLLNLCEKESKFDFQYFSTSENYDFFFKKTKESKHISEINFDEFDVIINESKDLEENLIKSAEISEKYFIDCDPLSEHTPYYSKNWNFEKRIKNPSAAFIAINNLIDLKINLNDLNIVILQSASCYGKKEISKFFKELKSFQLNTNSLSQPIAVNNIFKNSSILESEFRYLKNIDFSVQELQVSCALGSLISLNFKSELNYDEILNKIQKSHLVYLQDHLTSFKCANEEEVFIANLKNNQKNCYSAEVGFDAIKIQAINILYILEKIANEKNDSF